MRLIILVIISMLMNIFPTPSYSNVTYAKGNDYESHWAKTEITKWIKSELIKGYPDGNFKPDSPIKRVEFFALVNRAFGLDEQEKVQFKDLSSAFWGYETVQTAVKYGVTNGYEDDTVRPNAAITRQEVAVILQRILGLSVSQTQNIYVDAPWMPAWSERSIMAVTDSKIMNGYLDGTFGLETKMTRAETVVTLERALKKNVFAFSKAGTYGENKEVRTVKRDLVISVAGVTLQNVTIAGNLTLGAGIGEGDVFLKNVIVSGTTIVQGGGSQSIHLDNVTASRIIVDKPGDAPVRLVSSGTTSVVQVEIRSAVKLEEQDAAGKGFQAVTVSKELPETAKVELAGNFEEVSVQASTAKIEVQSGKVATVNVPEGAKEVTFTIGAAATVEKLVSDAVVKVEGKGKLETAELGEKAKDSKFVLKPAEVTGAAAESVKAAIKKQEEDDEKAAAGVGGAGAGAGGGGFLGGGSSGSVIPPESSSTGVEITGTVSLPNGEVAGSQGVTVLVLAHGKPSNYNQTVTIPAGQNQTTYSIKSISTGSYMISYQYNGNDYVPQGFYDGFKVTGKDYSNSKVDVLTSTTVNIELIKGIVLQGVVSLPNNEVAGSAGELVSLVAHNSNQVTINKAVFIPAGLNSASYSVRIATGSFLLGYYTNSTEYVRSGYLTSSGSMTPYFNWENFKFLELTNDYAVNVGVIKGNRITGTFYLPNGDVAGVNGETINIIVQNHNTGFQYGYSIDIPAGSTSGTFVGSVPSGNYVVGYNYLGKSFVNRAYYNLTSMVASHSYATVVQVTNTTQVDLFAMKGSPIRGVLKLPNGEIAGTNGVVASVSVCGEFGCGIDTVTIPAGSNEISFVTSKRFATGSYLISANFNGVGYIPQSIYTLNGMTARNDGNMNVTLLNFDNPLQLQLLKGVKVTVEVRLPDGDVAPAGGLLVDVFADSYTFGISGFNRSVFIPSSQSFAKFEKTISTGAYIFGMHYSGKKYVETVYYKAGKTIPYPGYTSSKETVLTDTSINLDLLTGVEIQTTVKLPNGEIAGVNGVGVTITYSESNNNQYVYAWIPRGENSVINKKTIPTGSYLISYDYFSGSDYVRNGYYKSGSMVGYYKDAARELINSNSTYTVELIKGVTISGTVSLPGGELAPAGGTSVTIQIVQEFGYGYGRTFTIPTGSNSISYSFPSDLAKGNYFISYSAKGGDYIEYFHYNAGRRVTINSDTTIDFVLIKGVKVTTTVKLPNGAVAGENGEQVQIDFYANNNQNSVSATIPSGQNSVVVTKILPTGSYLIYYFYHSGQNYIYQGYYSSGVMKITGSNSDRETITANKSITVELIKGLSVSGTMSLPNSEVAPIGGVRVQVELIGSQYYSKTFTIPAGQNSVGYSFAGNITPGNYWISYSYSGNNYVQRGYYNAGSMVLSTNSISQTSVTTASTINLTLIKGVQVSGTVSLPNGEVAPSGGVSLEVNIYNNSGVGYSKSLIIPAGQTSTNYSMNVPTGSYYIKYTYYGGSYVQSGFNQNGQTVPVAIVTTIIADTTINLTMIKGVLVQTKVQLPNGEVAGGKGEQIQIDFSANNNQNSFSAFIPAGQNSVTVSKRIPTGSYLISYYSYGQNYVYYGVYSSGVMKITGTNSDLETIATDKSITIELIKGLSVSGTISLPNGELAPSGGVQVTVMIEGNRSVSVTIPAGQNSITYAMNGNVTPGNYWISYSYSGNNYVQRGYYNAGSMVLSTSGISQTSVTTASTINLTMIKGVQVSGTVSLPNGEVAPSGGVSLEVNIYTNSGVSYSKSLIIPAGQSITSYSMNVPSGSYYIRYTYYGGSYVQTGFNQNGQTVPTATLTVVNADTTINLTMIKGVLVQTKVQLPNGEVAGINGVNVRMYFNGAFTQNFLVYIPAGQNSVTVSKRISTGSYLVSYYSYIDKYIRTMYYSAGEMVIAGNATAESFVTDSTITLQLVRVGYFVSGQVVLPNGEVAPNGGLVINAILKSGNQQWQNQVTIPQGSATASYYFQVPSGSYILGYSIVTASSSYLSAGYVDGSGMTPTLPTSNNLPVNRDITLPITLIRKP